MRVMEPRPYTQAFSHRSRNHHVREPRREYRTCCRCCYPSRYARLLFVIVLISPSMRKKTTKLQSPAETTGTFLWGVQFFFYINEFYKSKWGDAVEFCTFFLFPWGCQVPQLRRLQYRLQVSPSSMQNSSPTVYL